MPVRLFIGVIEGSLEPELRHLGEIADRFELAIDVGANEGVYTYVMTRYFRRVVSFEPDTSMAEALASCNLPGVVVHPVGLSSRAGEATLYTPLQRGVPLTGWASLRQEHSPDATQYLEQRVSTAVLDSFQLRDVTFLKIDVEGHELEVLKGAAETLSLSRPVLLLEVAEQNRLTVRAFLATLGYSPVALGELVHGATGSPQNQIYWPNERRCQP
jgi:FkbM family methyltransferase